MLLFRAPELPHHLNWFNTHNPLSLRELKGRVVLLDFWTYCCINCMHVLPDLHYLEEKFTKYLTIIGIHSPKFPNEAIDNHLEKAIERYNIKHPIANDPKLSVWCEYGVHAWPTFVLINTEGFVVAQLAGEGHRQKLDQLITDLIKQAQQAGTLTSQFVPLTIKPKRMPNQLSFPGKIIADQQHIYVSDSNHQRILVMDYEGKLLKIFAEDQLNHAQGLTMNEQFFWVADTGNRCIKQVDKRTAHVTTLAENLNSPWDIIYYQNKLYIAMAGSHQIWAYDLVKKFIYPFSGSGYEHLQDGPASFAAFAQPSGLTIGEGILYVADAETSAIRATNIADGYTTTLVGTGLFDFGDKDGVGLSAQLQHPLSISYDQSRCGLWISDSYNHKIKFLTLSTKQVLTWDLQSQLAEPAGIYCCENTLWIADTNHHRIIKFDLLTHQEMIIENITYDLHLSRS